MPVTIGDDIDVPDATAWYLSTTVHDGSVQNPSLPHVKPPLHGIDELHAVFVGGQSPVKMLFGDPGNAPWLSAPMTMPPGARMSGFGTPINVGPALEKSQISPLLIGCLARGICGRPPYASRRGSVMVIDSPSSDVQLGLSIVQPAAMIPALDAGSVTVASRTAAVKNVCGCAGSACRFEVEVRVAVAFERDGVRAARERPRPHDVGPTAPLGDLRIRAGCSRK